MVLHRAQPAQEQTISEGDLVIIYESHASMKSMTVTAKGAVKYTNRYGEWNVKDWIGKPFGSKVFGKHGAWVYLLAPTPELWTQVLSHRTQILYVADISQICLGLDLRPGSVVLESGTGSGSLTHSLARCVAPSGHVHTFEFHKVRCDDACREFAQNGLSEYVTCLHRDIEATGFPESLHGKADGVILDLPGPWKVVESAAKCLKPNGRFCGFSPCIEQVQRTAEQLRRQGFTDVSCVECLLRYYDVRHEMLSAPCLLTTQERAAARGGRGGRSNQGAAGRKRAAQAELSQDDGPPVKKAAPEGAAPGSIEGQQGAAVAAGGEVAPSGEVNGDAGDGAPGSDGLNADGAAGNAVAEGAAVASAADNSSAQPAAAGAREGLDAGGEPVAGVGQANGVKASSAEKFACAVPQMFARGHTGYLLFARKLVPMSLLRSLAKDLGAGDDNVDSGVEI